MLDPEEARAALIDLVKNSDQEVLKIGLPRLRSDKVERLGGSKIAIGNWHIDLANRTFVLALGGPAGLVEFNGTFERANISGPWRAQITQIRQT